MNQITITKVNGKQWDKETPLNEFHDNSCLIHTEVLKRFIRCELQQQSETTSGAIPKMFEAKSDELAAAKSVNILRKYPRFNEFIKYDFHMSVKFEQLKNDTYTMDFPYSGRSHIRATLCFYKII